MKLPSLVVYLSVVILPVTQVFSDDSLYLNEVKPLLAEKCVSCHGPLKQESGLRLDAASFVRKGTEFGPVVVSGKPTESTLIQRVATDSADERMPPEGEGEPLKPEQIATLTRWVKLGMPAPDDEEIVTSPSEHWAFQKINRPSLPANSEADVFNPIDQFLEIRHRERGLAPLPRADAETLLRRISLDVIGLPPSLIELKQFRQDSSQIAYESFVNQLLESPRYGERWGRHWMDVWRYSDWSGYKNQLRGSQRHIWHWRDWIIESLNEDKSYDQMIVEMLAGDETAPTNPDVLRATGFLARNYHNSNRNIWLDATVEHTAKAFLGLTVNCARCHDHKFDPIAQQEYYTLRAIFEPYNVRTDRLPGESDLMKAGIARVYDKDLNAKTFLYRQGNEKFPDEDNPLAPGVIDLLGLPFEPNAIDLPAAGYFPSMQDFIKEEELRKAATALTAAEKEILKLKPSMNEQPVDSSPDSSRPPSPALPREVSQEQFLAQYKHEAAKWNLDSLRARWRSDRAKYLENEQSKETLQSLAKTAAHHQRHHAAAVARLTTFQKWQAFEKSQTTEKSASDKAKKELAAARDNEQKALAALTKQDSEYTPVGEVFPAKSTGRRLAFAQWIVHPENPLTARVAVNHIWHRHFGTPLVANMFDFGMRSPRPVHAELLDWLAVEFIESGWSMKHLHRLILTSQAYQRASHAPGEKFSRNLEIDPDNHDYWRANVKRLESEVIRDSVLFVSGQLDLTMSGPDLDYADGENTPRRSIYFRHAYEKQMLMMTIFDAASPNECYRRSPSVIPQQALALSNSQLALSAARKLASQLSNSDQDNARFIELVFETVLSRSPTREETRACNQFLEQQSQLLSGTNQLAEVSGGSEVNIAPSESPKMRARENLTHVLLNHNDFVAVR